MKNYILILLSIIILSSCSSDTLFKEFTNIPLLNWKKDNTISYVIDIENDTTNFNLIVAVRYAAGNPFKNIPVELTITSPSQKKYIINSEIQLIDDAGDYIGDGAGDIWDVEVPVKENYLFEEKGEYFFDIKQTSNREELPFMMEIGLIIKKMAD